MADFHLSTTLVLMPEEAIDMGIDLSEFIPNDPRSPGIGSLILQLFGKRIADLTGDVFIFSEDTNVTFMTWTYSEEEGEVLETFLEFADKPTRNNLLVFAILLRDREEQKYKEARDELKGPSQPEQVPQSPQNKTGPQDQTGPPFIGQPVQGRRL